MRRSYLWPSTTNDQSINQSIQVVDTGLDPTHTEFDDNDSREVLNVWDGYAAISDPTASNDVDGHGSHCAGTVGGSSIGVAPGANIYGVKVLSDDGSGDWGTVIAGIAAAGDAVASTGKPSVVSMSLGGVSFFSHWCSWE